MEEEEDFGTPFWIQSTTNLRHADRLRRRASAVFFSSGLVVFLLSVTAVFFLVFVVPSTISFSSQIFKPSNIKKSWDSLNIILVLIAVVFGFLSKIKNEDKYSSSYYEAFQDSPNKHNESQKLNPSDSNDWYNYNKIEGPKHNNLSIGNDWSGYSDYQSKLEYKDSVLRRNSSSYPDLREFSSNRFDYGDFHRRYYDDIHVDVGRVSDPGQLHRRHRSLEEVDGLRLPPTTNAVFVDTLEEVGRVAEPGQLHRRHRSMEEVDGVGAAGPTKAIFVDTLGSYSKESKSFQPSSSPPRSVPVQLVAPPVEYEEKPKTRAYESVARKKERSSRRLYKDYEYMNPVTAAKPHLPSPSIQPPEMLGAESPANQEKPMRSNESAGRKREISSRRLNKEMGRANPVMTPPPPPPQKSSESERKRGGTSGSATKDFLNSLYHKKKKKPRQKSVENLDSLLHQSEAPLSFQIPPSPPPPPPPPPSVLQNLFSSKKQKRKRTITVAVGATEQPEAPVPTQPAAAREPNPTSETEPITNQRPPKPVNMNPNKFDEISNNGGESPLNRIPPPPPPPPPPGFLKNHAWKFVFQGDYVRIDSTASSRSGSPDLDDVDSDATPSAADVGGGTPFHPSPLFCPSPDVNSKAESFITNFRAKLKLEKIHSMKKRDLGLSSLGPGPGPGPSPI